MSTDKFADYLRGEVPYSLTHVLIEDMTEGQKISQCFLARRKTQRVTRNGQPFLELTLADRSGTIPARAWSDVAQRFASAFSEGEFVRVDGRTETYRNTLQLIVESIQRLESLDGEASQITGFDPSILVPSTERNIDEMWDQLMQIISSVEPEPLQKLVLNILSDNESQFRQFPAAITYHHAYLGGLLEHTLEVTQGIEAACSNYPFLNRGLAIAGAVLHDIGKIQELTDPITPHHSFQGQLAGHLLIGRDLVRDAAAEVSWADDRLPGLLEHIIVSHHGQLEFGSAILPKTAEAIAVYLFDNLSAKLNMVRKHVDSDTESGDFTTWQKPLERKLFKGELDGTVDE